MKKIILIFCIFCNFLNAQTDSTSKFHVGARMKKYAGFYYVNGFSVNMKSPFSKNGSVYYGLNFGTTLLGSAFQSNALTTFETELTATKLYRVKKVVQPLLRINLGVVAVRFGEDAALFQDIPQWGIMSAVETGAQIDLSKVHPKLLAQITGGFHFYNNGPGVVYPAYAAAQICWKL